MKVGSYESDLSSPVHVLFDERFAFLKSYLGLLRRLYDWATKTYDSQLKLGSSTETLEVSFVQRAWSAIGLYR